MNFNLDPSKETQKPIISSKIIKKASLIFNNAQDSQGNARQNINLFNENYDQNFVVIKKINTNTPLLRKLQNIFPRASLLTI